MRAYAIAQQPERVFGANECIRLKWTAIEIDVVGGGVTAPRGIWPQAFTRESSVKRRTSPRRLREAVHCAATYTTNRVKAAPSWSPRNTSRSEAAAGDRRQQRQRQRLHTARGAWHDRRRMVDQPPRELGVAPEQVMSHRRASSACRCPGQDRAGDRAGGSGSQRSGARRRSYGHHDDRHPAQRDGARWRVTASGFASAAWPKVGDDPPQHGDDACLYHDRCRRRRGRYLERHSKRRCENRFNMISVDGDTSTNDMAVVLANGASEAQGRAGHAAWPNSLLRALRTTSAFNLQDDRARRRRCDQVDRGEGERGKELTRMPGWPSGRSRLLARQDGGLRRGRQLGQDPCAAGYSGADSILRRPRSTGRREGL